MPRKNNRAKTDLTQTETRRHVWRHNSFFGHARMMFAQCENIIKADSTTAETKEIAQRIINETRALTKALKERLDK